MAIPSQADRDHTGVNNACNGAHLRPGRIPLTAPGQTTEVID
jgi:hypothetical protein